MTTLTDKQRQVYDFVEEYQMLHGASPTIAEIKKDLKVSSDNSILKHLKSLERLGLIERSSTPRGIGLLQSVQERLFADVVVLPLLGHIPAGDPTQCTEEIETWIPVSSAIVKGKYCYLLKVKGDSMIGAGINEGDLVIVDSKREARDADIVVALVDGENTVKRLVKNGGAAYLMPENPAYQAIMPGAELSLQGVVVGLLRNYY